MGEIGKIVNVFGRNILRIAVPDAAFEKISRPGTYVTFRSSSGTQHLALVTGYLLVDELYKRGRVLEELEGYEDITVTRNEVTAVVVGYIRDGKIFKGVESLPAPGEKVFPADPEQLKLLLSAYDIDVGTLASTSDVNFTLDLNMLASRHFAVLAMTGSGKSNTVAVIVSRILEKYSNPRIVLIDTHSEYIPLAKVFKERVRVFSPSGRLSELIKLRYGIKPIPLEVPIWTLGFEEIAELLKLDNRATKQLLYLREALLAVRREKWPHATPDDPIYFKARHLVDNIGSSKGSRDDSAIDLKLKLSSLLDDPDLSFITSPVMSEEIYEKTSGAEPERSGRAYTQLYKNLFGEGLNIIALGGLPSEVQVTTVATILRALWRVVSAHVQAGSILPTLVIVEEAHVYAPKDRDVPSRQILEKIAKEGRKFGVGLGIVSQRPRELSQTLLAQCGTLIALRTTNPEDQRHIMLSIEDIIGELVQGLASLTVGQALISGAAAPVPAVINVHSFTRIYSVELGGKDVDWSKAWTERTEFLDVSRLLFAHRGGSGEGAEPGKTRDRTAKLENFLQ